MRRVFTVDACIVDQYVDMSGQLDRLFEHGLDLTRIRQVAGHDTADPVNAVKVSYRSGGLTKSVGSLEDR